MSSRKKTIKRAFVIIQNVIHGLTLFHVHPETREYIASIDASFKYDQVRSTILSYLIFSDSLTSTHVECPSEMIGRIEWLEKVFKEIFKDAKDIQFLEYVEETVLVPPPKQTA